MTDVEITVSIDPGKLGGYIDEFLAFAWHVAQHNPAPFGDWEAVDLVKRIGWEIIRRWLRGVDPEMHHHQADSNYHQWLCAFAKYEPPEGWNRHIDQEGAREFHRGRWVARPPEEVAAELVKRGLVPTEVADETEAPKEDRP